MKQIALITDDFSLHPPIISEMRSRGLKIATFRVGEEIPARIGVVITTQSEVDAIDFDSDHIVLTMDDLPEDADMVVNRAIMKLRDQTDIGIIIGIDPGEQTGVAVLAGNAVLSAYRVPMADVYQAVQRILRAMRVTHARDTIIRIGDGARLIRTQLINSLLKPGLRVELVDETGTTSVGRDSDMHAAIRIARLRGAPIGKQFITPSTGEIRSIQDQSREKTGGELTISRVLAEKVAIGELSLKNAILVQRGEK